ncbi:hypothetical protein [Dickeya lacustris]|uniref:Uncharacterized protein n=1 Tax=Dickeya lacustris TaxID=2259638 RepID=A0ABY8G8T3_9GAMM|nr:hypothetical protein [Dickeya lacustris]WFN56361.1 hypothetical protein O1Q98_03380 [Dickeya lacustris]
MSDEISIPSLISEDNPTSAPLAALANTAQPAVIQRPHAIPDNHANAFTGLQKQVTVYGVITAATGLTSNNVSHKKRRSMLIHTQTSTHFANAKINFNRSVSRYGKQTGNLHHHGLIRFHAGVRIAPRNGKTLNSKMRISQPDTPCQPLVVAQQPGGCR